MIGDASAEDGGKPCTPELIMATEESIPLPQVSMCLRNTREKGRGVYASQDIPYNTLIHISPLLLFPSGSAIPEALYSPERAVLCHYTYTFGRDHQALALGLGSMFNHSKHNNVGFIIDKPNLLIKYFSVTSISSGSELCINYGNHLWFDDTSENEDCSSSSDGDPFCRLDL